MRKIFIAMTLSVLAVLIVATPAMAGRTWCARDPIVRIEGHDVQFWVAIPEEFVPLVNGPIDIEILTPKLVETQVLFLDEGFNGYGETVTFSELKGGKTNKDGSFDVQVKVRVPIDTKKAKKIPLQFTISVDGQAIELQQDSWTYAGGRTYVVESDNKEKALTITIPN